LLLFEAFSKLIFQVANRKETAYNRAVLMAVLIGITGLLRGAIQGLHLYDVVAALLCGAFVFSLAVILIPVSESFSLQRSNRILFDGKTLFAKAALLCIGIISLQGLSLWNCELGTVLAGFAVMIFARRKGSAVGACTGALLGMVVAIYDLPASLEVPGMLALAGAAAGLPVKSRTASVSLWTAIVIFFSALTVLEGTLVIKYYEALAAGILFLLIPQRLLNWISDELAGVRGASDILEIKDGSQTHEAADRLFVLSKALSKVSRSIDETLAEDSEDDGSVAEWIIETVAERVCNRCSLCERCWGTHFIKTYRLIEKAISDLKTDETGQIEMPPWFKSTCTKTDKFVETLGSAYSIFKTENVWRQKLNETRSLLARQAAMVSSSVMSAARGLMDTSGRDYETEGRLLSIAANMGMPVTSFRLYNKQEAKPFLEVVYEAKNKINPKSLDDMIHEALQSGLVRVGESRRDLMGYSVVRYMRQPKFKSATGIARVSKESSMISGDNFAFFISSEGYHISAISDGAGTGRRAERYSRTAIQMLESLMEEGIEISLAIRLLNLYLNLRGENERLATMDICAIDLSSGEASFYKYGASASFIKGRTETQAILSEEKQTESGPATHYKPATLTAGDFAVMLSDGVLEVFSEQGEPTALQRFIEEVDTVNAQQLADTILQEALSRAKDKHDDMTVLVTRLW
ncbi:MAG: SpoIIE family protein phosphatase, partial [Clostridia bacterium]|nr:SpoIIE family protein phosphatase [Clostridia bacterium]